MSRRLDWLLAAAVIGFVLVYWAVAGWWLERLKVGHVRTDLE